MQDRTINNALLALVKQGGAQGSIAEGLLMLRDVPIPTIRQHQPLKRGGTAAIVLYALRDGPKTVSQIGDEVRRRNPQLSRRNAYNRAYQALLRLEERGAIQKRDEWPRAVWWLDNGSRNG